MKILQMLRLFAVSIAIIPWGSAVGADHRDRVIAEDLFIQEQIPQLRIELSRPALEQLRQHERTYVLGTVREGNTTYTNVSIRLKGGPGSFRRLEDKPAFTVNFGRQAEGQKFHGLKKIHLNNSVQDSTYLGEKISRELFEAAGVPAPRAGHATVELNGRNLGFYVLIEGINKQFLHRYFKNAEGNVYDGHSQSEVTRPMRTNSGEDRRNKVHLQVLAAAAQQPNLETRLAKLNENLDVDRFISFLATEVMICHWDGYAMNRNNFRIYDDLDSGHLVFLPQGTDQVFQRTTTAVFPPVVGLVAKSVLEIPELRERYRERMVQLLTNVYRINAITNHLYDVAAKIQPRLAAVDSQAGAAYPTKVRAFCRRIQQRVRNLEQQLLSASPEAEFDPTGILKLSAWQQQIDIGAPVLNLDETTKERPLLHITAREPSAASWRTRIMLDRGSYRFLGRIRLEGVKLDEQDAKAGAGLRISRRKFGQPLSGNLGWTVISYNFNVPQDHTDVEVVCELRALEGQAWFDAKSLRIIRAEPAAE